MKTRIDWHRWLVVAINVALLVCVLLVWLARSLFRAAGRAVRCLA